jgi:hypothetical protein
MNHIMPFLDYQHKKSVMQQASNSIIMYWSINQYINQSMSVFS